MPAFKDILNQPHAVEWLQRAYEAGRLPHGLIFAGPVGVGKGTTAMALGAMLLCENPQANDSCGLCGSCKVIESGTHPDFRVITKELIRQYDAGGKSKGIELSVKVIRPELVERAGRKSVLGRGKVFVIEQAELMNPEAQNAMLKTLEEPAERTAIILLTDQPGLLLPTVRSRCQVVQFGMLPVEVVRRELEKRGFDKKLAASAAKLTDGSLGLAVRWIEDEVVPLAEELVGKLDTLIAGKPVAGLGEWLRKSADAYGDKQIERDEFASKAQAVRDGLGLYLKISAEQFRRLLESEDDSDQLERIAGAIDAIARAEMYMDSYVNTPLVLQQLTLAMEDAFAAQLNH